MSRSRGVPRAVAAVGALLTLTLTGACASSRSAPSPSSAAPPGSPGRATASSPGPGAARYPLGRYQPLWPFGDEAEAETWQVSYHSGGHQPWHLAADQTALAFVRFLGFDTIDRVTRQVVQGADARVTVGYRSGETGEGGTAAVLHLIKIGTPPDAPWEVVGTDDSDLSLTTPAYGATVSSAVTVGGKVTGVDESIRVEIRQRSGGTVLGRFCCVPAGGQGRAWSARAPFQGATDPVLTIVASTGGHLAAVERFAVTGVRVAR